MVPRTRESSISINDLFLNFKVKKRKDIKPVGFSIGNSKLFLTNIDGKLIVVDLSLGKTTKIEKIAGNLISKPYIYNQNLFLIKNGSILQFD